MKNTTLSKGWYDRGWLPHCDFARLTQFITFRLGDSLPEQVCQRLITGKSRYSEQLGNILDNGIGACLLRNSTNAEIVKQVLLNRDGIDYHLHAWSIMPNHAHTLLTPIISLELIVKAWKSVSSRKIITPDNKLWYSDYFDRYIRNESHFVATKFYIEMNPVKANLCRFPEEWKYSSAYGRETSR